MAKVTKQRSKPNDRFQCSDVYQLWDDGEVTLDHCIEDQEWGGQEDTREVVEREALAADFFSAGRHRVIDRSGAVREEPLC